MTKDDVNAIEMEELSRKNSRPSLAVSILSPCRPCGSGVSPGSVS
jgi:hypothetical protein